jgi:hypothetical protein
MCQQEVKTYVVFSIGHQRSRFEFQDRLIGQTLFEEIAALSDMVLVGASLSRSTDGYACFKQKEEKH